jgi:hypothetical protein
MSRLRSDPKWSVRTAPFVVSAKGAVLFGRCDVRRDIIRIRIVFFFPGPAPGFGGGDRTGRGRLNRLQEEQDVK